MFLQGWASSISCAGNEFNVREEGSCEGDSGSPVVKKISDTARGKPYYEQHFISSTGIDCELQATIYVRLTQRKILTWIQKVACCPC